MRGCRAACLPESDDPGQLTDDPVTLHLLPEIPTFAFPPARAFGLAVWSLIFSAVWNTLDFLGVPLPTMVGTVVWHVNARFLRHFILKTIFLPRQARDKQGKVEKKHAFHRFRALHLLLQLLVGFPITLFAAIFVVGQITPDGMWDVKRTQHTERRGQLTKKTH